MSKVVLISGASSGLGRSMAHQLAKKGYKVYGSSRQKMDQDPLIEFLQIDLSDIQSIKSAIHTIETKHNRLDLLINNAGIGIIGPLEFTEPSVVLNAFQTNAFGPMELSRLAIPLLKKAGKSQIATISTIAGEVGLPYRGIYSSSKAALEMYMESLSMELKPFGISVQIIQPGDFASGIAAKRLEPKIPSKSDYPHYDRIIQEVNRDVNQAWSTELMASKIIVSLESGNPPLRKRIAPFMQKLSITLKHSLPSRMFERIIMNHYKL